MIVGYFIIAIAFGLLTIFSKKGNVERISVLVFYLASTLIFIVLFFLFNFNPSTLVTTIFFIAVILLYLSIELTTKAYLRRFKEMKRDL
jgi:uncharacterized membrane protein YfcA